MKVDSFERLNKMQLSADRYYKPVRGWGGAQPLDLWYFPFDLTQELDSSSLEKTPPLI